MASAQDFLSYTGNAGLGLGTNAGVPVAYPKELDFANQNLRDAALWDHQNNILKYKQAIDDRDNLYKALQDGTVKVGATLEQDLPTVRKALDEQTQAYFDWMKKGYGDIDGAMNYKKATQNANEVVTQAQARKIFYDKQNQDNEKELVPEIKNARTANTQKVLGDFWGNLDPYQPTATLDTDAIEKFVQPKTIQIPDDGKHPLATGKRTYLSYDDTVKNAGASFLTPQGSYNLTKLHDVLQSMQPLDLYNRVKEINSGLAKYNQDRGLKEGDPDYAAPIQAVPQKDDQGNLVGIDMNEPLDKLAAKFSLAGRANYQTDTWELDKSKQALANLQILKEKADSDAFYKHAMAGAAQTKAKAYAANLHQQMSYRKTQADKDQYLDELWNKNLYEQKSLTTPDNKNQFGGIKADESLPIYTIKDGKATQLMPIDAKPRYDQENKDGTPKKGAKFLYYEGGHYDQEYLMNGKSMSPQQIANLYQDFKKANGKNWNGSLDDFVKEAIKANKFEVKLKGSNGTSDRMMSRAAQQLISNKATGKGEMGVFSTENPPTDETIIEQNSSTDKDQENQ